MTRKLFAVLAPLALLLTLAGCGDSKVDYAGDSDRVHVSDAWIKASEEGSTMTSAFAKIHNDSDKSVQIVSASSDDAGMVQLHEVVSQNGANTMREKPGGYTIEEGQTLELTPGGDHIMLMDVKHPFTAGQDYELTLVFSDGSKTTIKATARDFAGNDENYGDIEGHEGHDMSDMPGMTEEHSHN